MTANDQFVLWVVTYSTMGFYFIVLMAVVAIIAFWVKHFSGVNIFKWLYNKFF
jgi:hypothetical protein